MVLVDAIAGLVLGTPLLTAAVDYAVFIVTVFIFIQNRKENPVDSFLFLLMGLSFLFMGYVNSLIVLNRDIWLISQLTAMQTLAWAILFTAIVSKMSHIRRLDYLLAIVLISVVSVFITFGYVVFVLLPPIAYYIAGMAFFVIYDSSAERMRNAGIIGLIGCLFGIVAAALGLSLAHPVWMLVNILFLVSFHYFMRFGLTSSHMEMPARMELVECKSKGGHAIIQPFAYIFCYALLLNLSIFLATVGLHEGGHMLVGNMIGCEGGRVVLMDLMKPDVAGPYTEMRCPVDASGYILGFSGFTLLVPFGLMFLILRKFPERNLAYVVFGLAIIVGGIDLTLIFNNPLVPDVALLIGAVLVCAGEVFLVNDYIGLVKRKNAISDVLPCGGAPTENAKTQRRW